MSYQFGNRRWGSNASPQQQQCMPNNMGYNGGGGYSGNYGQQQQQPQMMQMQMNPMQMQMQMNPMAAYGRSNNNNYGGGSNMMYGGQQQQQQQQYGAPSPRVSVLPAGQQPDAGMKVIKLNWGDLLGGGGQNGTQPLKVAMVGPNGDLSSGGNNGLRVTFNGEVPQGMPCHVLNINPYSNIMGGGQQ